MGGILRQEDILPWTDFYFFFILAKVMVKVPFRRKYLFGGLKNEQEFNQWVSVRERKKEDHSGQIPAIGRSF